MTKPATVPTWDTTAANLSTPTAPQTSAGWALDEVPTSGNMNFLMYWFAQWIGYLSAGSFTGGISVDTLAVSGTSEFAGNVEFDLAIQAEGLATLNGGVSTGAIACSTMHATGIVTLDAKPALGSGVYPTFATAQPLCQLPLNFLVISPNANSWAPANTFDGSINTGNSTDVAHVELRGLQVGDNLTEIDISAMSTSATRHLTVGITVFHKVVSGTPTSQPSTNIAFTNAGSGTATAVINAGSFASSAWTTAVTYALLADDTVVLNLSSTDATSGNVVSVGNITTKRTRS